MDAHLIETGILAMFIGLGNTINIVRGRKADKGRGRQTAEIKKDILEKFEEHAISDQTNFSQLGAAMGVVGMKVETMSQRLARLEQYQDQAALARGLIPPRVD